MFRTVMRFNSEQYINYFLGLLSYIRFIKIGRITRRMTANYKKIDLIILSRFFQRNRVKVRNFVSMLSIFVQIIIFINFVYCVWLGNNHEMNRLTIESY